MDVGQHISAAPKLTILLALAIGAIVGGLSAVAVLARVPVATHGGRTATHLSPIVSAHAQNDTAATLTATNSVGHGAVGGVQLSDREREVLARLARLPDLPTVRAPAFDVKVQAARASEPSDAVGVGKQVTPAPAAPAGDSVMARIQVVSVEKGRVFYRSVDDQMHTARAGERLLGVNGRVLSIDEHGAELQIDGRRMRVAGNNM